MHENAMADVCEKLLSPTPIYFALFFWTSFFRRLLFLSYLSLLKNSKKRREKLQRETTATITCSNLPTLRSSSTQHSSAFSVHHQICYFSSAERRPELPGRIRPQTDWPNSFDFDGYSVRNRKRYLSTQSDRFRWQVRCKPDPTSTPINSSVRVLPWMNNFILQRKALYITMRKLDKKISRTA